MFWIFRTDPQFGDDMMQYDADEMTEVFGGALAARLKQGEAVFMGGAIYVNAAIAAQREVDNLLMTGEAA